MKKGVLFIAFILILTGCNQNKYPDGFKEDLPFGLKYYMSQKETFSILDSLVKINKISSYVNNAYKYTIPNDYRIEVTITLHFYNDSLYSIDIRNNSYGKGSEKVNYKSTIYFFETQKINLNLYRNYNRDFARYWDSKLKSYEITFVHGDSYILVFDDGVISKRLTDEEAKDLSKKAQERYENGGTVKVENSVIDGSVSQVKKYIKQTLKDPDSYKSIEWSKVKETNNGYEVQHRYRAKNSFGGYVIEEHIYYLDFQGNVIDVE